ncbi:MAG: TldD/PmbA family protein [Candidatus Xenobia bacterium]
MQTCFYELADYLGTLLRGEEIYTASYKAEDSEFARFNQAQVRQAGNVVQQEISLELISGRRHAKAATTLSGEADTDRERLRREVADLREMLPHLPDDPFLDYATELRSSERVGENQLPNARETVREVLDAGQGTDMVGIFASGGIYTGFANSLGQRNWHATYSYNLDWSLYHREDKAVKSGYSGFEWKPQVYRDKMGQAREQLSLLSRPARTIEPGRYRVYLSPVALSSIVNVLSWRAFGLRDARTRRTALLKMLEGAQVDSRVHVLENTEGGIAPDFQTAGYIKPGRVPLIEGGCFRQPLASPRTAREYNVPTNGANDEEMPESVEIRPGGLPSEEILRSLEKGIYINNLWYLNYSDLPACRLTGMTRFACFWVEGGEIQQPLNVMRFDETFYRMFGDRLIDLTQEQDFILSPYTYGGRNTGSYRLPGALIDEFTFTL